jgi:hypothetical protein
MIITLAALAAAMIIVSFTRIKLTNEGYDRLKWLVVRWSGILTFLGALVSVFKFEHGAETITVVAAIGAFLAYMLGISEKDYNDGAAVDAKEGGVDEISDDYFLNSYEDEDEGGEEDENEDIPTV